MDCPNCRKPMAPHQAERLYGQGTLALDLCRGCLAVWFDDKELLQLSPAASIQLLGEFAKEDAGHARRRSSRRSRARAAPGRWSRRTTASATRASGTTAARRGTGGS